MVWVIKPTGSNDDLLYSKAGTPSLDLRFASTKTLTDYVTSNSLVTFTRSSSGTYVDSQGMIRTATTNEPRFDHNPLTGESLGLLVEESRTNVLRWSEDSSQWLSPANATLTQNATTAPDGATTADQMLETTTNTLHSQEVSDHLFVAGTTYTYSVFVKSIGGRNYEIGFPSVQFGTSRFARFNLTSGAVQGTDAGVTATITAFPNGWYRCSATSTCSAGGGARPANFINNASFARVYAGDATRGIFVWGIQLELGAFPTSYIPTTTPPVTRSADVADIINTAIANGIRTLYAEFRSPASATRGVVSLNDNSANERAAINSSGTDPRLVVVDGGVTQADIDAGTIVANARSRMAVRISADNFAASFNGEAVVSDTSGSLPTVDRLFIGRSQAGEYLNAPIARLVGWREELSDIALQELTR